MTSILKEFSAKLRIKEKTPLDTCVEEILDKEEEPYEKVSWDNSSNESNWNQHSRERIIFQTNNIF